MDSIFQELDNNLLQIMPEFKRLFAKTMNCIVTQGGNKDLQHAALVRLNEYKNILYAFEQLNIQTESSHESLKWPNTLKEFNNEIESVNVGKGLFQLIDEADEAISHNPPRHALASSRIFLVIHLMKHALPLIPLRTKIELITKTNVVIMKRNNHVHNWESCHGIIKTLTPYHAFSDNDFITVNWYCEQCSFSWHDVMCSSHDIFAHSKCPKCKYPFITHVSVETNMLRRMSKNVCIHDNKGIIPRFRRGINNIRAKIFRKNRDALNK
jgi:predicted Zn-ribbon and HTH transcriptional regulator|uniref:Uncharacterized protein n=1 Tax=viral metagenome TaxID=1070528 RepID=A0A6C0BEK5_9ZZZZ